MREMHVRNYECLLKIIGEDRETIAKSLKDNETGALCRYNYSGIKAKGLAGFVK